MWYLESGRGNRDSENKGTQLSGRASTELCGHRSCVQKPAPRSIRHYKSRAGVVVTATHGASTIVANAATIAAPPLAAADLVTGGAGTRRHPQRAHDLHSVAKVALGRGQHGRGGWH